MNIANVDTRPGDAGRKKFTMVTDKLASGRSFFAHWRYPDNEKWIPKNRLPASTSMGAEARDDCVTGDNFRLAAVARARAWAIRRLRLQSDHLHVLRRHFFFFPQQRAQETGSSRSSSTRRATPRGPGGGGKKKHRESS